MKSAGVGRLPAALVVPAVLAALLLALPVLGLALRVPWDRMPALLGTAAAGDALRITLLTSVVSTAACVALGLPLAVLLTYGRLPGLGVVRALVTVPLVLPPVVAGVALLAAYGRRGLAGRLVLDWFGLSIPFTTLAVVVAHVFVSLPFFVITVEAAMRQVPMEYAEAAADLGANELSVFRRVTLPLTLPAIGAGALLSFARSLGEFGATITFAGNYPGTTQTWPLLTYTELNRDPDSAYVLAMVMLVVCLVVLVVLRQRWLDAPVVEQRRRHGRRDPV